MFLFYFIDYSLNSKSNYSYRNEVINKQDSQQGKKVCNDDTSFMQEGYNRDWVSEGQTDNIWLKTEKIFINALTHKYIQYIELNKHVRQMYEI